MVAPLPRVARTLRPVRSGSGGQNGRPPAIRVFVGLIIVVPRISSVSLVVRARPAIPVILAVRSGRGDQLLVRRLSLRLRGGGHQAGLAGCDNSLMPPLATAVMPGLTRFALIIRVS